MESNDPIKASDVLAFTYKVDIFSTALYCAEMLFEDYKKIVKAELYTKGITEEGLNRII